MELDNQEVLRQRTCKKYMAISIGVFLLMLVITRHSILQFICQLSFGTTTYVPDVCRNIVCAIFVASTLSAIHFYWSINHIGGIKDIFDYNSEASKIKRTLMMMFIAILVIGEFVASGIQNETIVIKDNGGKALSCDKYLLISDSIDGDETSNKGVVFNKSSDTLCYFKEYIYTIASGKSPKYIYYVCIPPHSHVVCYLNPNCYFEESGMNFEPENDLYGRHEDSSSSRTLRILDKKADVRLHHHVTPGFIETVSKLYKAGNLNNIVSFVSDYGLTKNANYPTGWEQLEKDININLDDPKYYYIGGITFEHLNVVEVEFIVKEDGSIAGIEYVGKYSISTILLDDITENLSNLKGWLPAERKGETVPQKVRLSIFTAK